MSSTQSANADVASHAPARTTGWLSRRSLLRGLVAACGVSALVWCGWVYREIEQYATTDQARPADAIAVFGAAEYDGHPSPVLRARLEQALLLYRRGLAPLIITLGGSGDPQHSEGEVGQNFLIAQGVPEPRIIAETQSRSTVASARRLAAIAEENRLASIIAVSDGTHLFRIHELCRSYGLTVYTSPRALGRPISRWQHLRRMLHEIASYTGWRLGLR